MGNCQVVGGNHTSDSGETRAEIRTIMMKSIANTSIIFAEKEYHVGRQEYNHGVGQIPHDFTRFDPTELESPLRELLHATDQRAYIQEKDGRGAGNTIRQNRDRE